MCVCVCVTNWKKGGNLVSEVTLPRILYRQNRKCRISIGMETCKECIKRRRYAANWACLLVRFCLGVA